jgi:hypothetical protein
MSSLTQLDNRSRSVVACGAALLVGRELPAQRKIIALGDCECLLECGHFVAVAAPQFLQLCRGARTHADAVVAGASSAAAVLT